MGTDTKHILIYICVNAGVDETKVIISFEQLQQFSLNAMTPQHLQRTQTDNHHSGNAPQLPFLETPPP